LTSHHDSFGKLKVTIIAHNPKRDDQCRQERENFWIKKLKTLSNIFENGMIPNDGPIEQTVYPNTTGGDQQK
jgi:hypothetical protein